MQQGIQFIRESLQGIYPPEEIKAFIRLIFEKVCDYTLTDMLLHKNNILSPCKRQEIESIVRRLQQNEPIQYILGYTEFHGIRIGVAPGVLIPRPETGELVDIIIQENRNRTGRIADIGTGSGCIAISLAKFLPAMEVEGWDISPVALQIASKNALDSHINVSFLNHDILNSDFSKITHRYDIIVSNPPYICDYEKQHMEKNVLEYEPHLTLFVPDSDPLRFYRVIGETGKVLLNPGGKLYFEINALLWEETVHLISELGYNNVLAMRDIYGKNRFISALNI